VLSLLRWSLVTCILSLTPASALDSGNTEKTPTPQAAHEAAPANRALGSTGPKQKPAKDKEDTEGNTPHSLLNVSPDTQYERELHNSLISRVRSLNSGKEKREVELETPAKHDDAVSIWEDFKLPLMIIGGLLVYFIPTLLGMRMNDFKKVFFINLFLGCTVGLGLAALHIKPFPEQWLYIYAGVSLGARWCHCF